MDDKDNKKTVADRRSFLKLAGLGAVTGSAAVMAGTPSPEAAEAGKDADSLYRETDHVKRYYELAKFI